MIQYIAILITAIVGIFGIIAKTGKDGKSGHFNKLTPTGILVLTLVIAGLIANVFIQKDADTKLIQERKDSENKSIRDSLQTRNNFLKDSFGHEVTIKSLKEQARLNRIKWMKTLLDLMLRCQTLEKP